MKKTILIVAPILVVLAIGGYVFNAYLTPDIRLTQQVVTVGNSNVEICDMPSYSTKLGLPANGSLQEFFTQLATDNATVKADVQDMDNSSIAMDMKNVDKKLVVTYSGDATDSDGNSFSYAKEFVYDYNLTGTVMNYGEIPVI